jgi:hypothetical protein
LFLQAQISIPPKFVVKPIKSPLAIIIEIERLLYYIDRRKTFFIPQFGAQFRIQISKRLSEQTYE